MSDSDFTDLLSKEQKKPSVIERTLHTIHTLVIYPDGSVYLKKPISWLDKKSNVVKKKEKKAPVKVEEAKLQKLESW